MSTDSPTDAAASPEGFERRGGRRPRRGLILIVILVVVVLVAAAVALAVSFRQPVSNTGAVVNVGLTLEPSNLDIRTTSGAALDQLLMDNVYQGLVTLDAKGAIVDDLASAHSVSSDGLTYTFTVRKGVTFHDGSPMTVSDVVWSLQQVVDHATTYVGATDFANVSSVTAGSGSTVVITLSKPVSQFLWDLANRPGIVLEQGATGNLKTAENGTGPYTLGTWKHGDSITLDRYAGYWGTKAKVSQVVLHYITDTGTAVSEALSGQLDVAVSVDSDLLSRFAGKSDFTLEPADESSDIFTLGYNTRQGALSDVRVRKALNMAIDQKAILDLINDTGTAIGGPIPKTDPGYADLTGVNAYDPDKARALLAKAGAENLSLTLKIPNIYPTAVAELVAQQFAKVGVTLSIDPVSFGTWLSDVYTNHDYQVSFIDIAESHAFANYANPDYYLGYDSSKVQSLVAQASTATDPDTADALLQKAAAIVARQAPAKWLYNWTPVTAVNTSISGFPTQSVNARLNLGSLSKGD